MATAPLYNAAGERLGDFDLHDGIFGKEPKEHLIHQAVVRELANRRQGTHDTLSRSEVRGGGKKPYRQKGTGRARQGSTRAPHWRHGGIVHGPTPRGHGKEMPRKMRRAALLSALSGKAAGGAIVVVDSLQMESVSSREFGQILQRFSLRGNTMLVLAKADDNVALSARNLPNVKLRILPGLSTYEVAAADTLLFTQAAVERLQEGASA
jgi:large subunit ribosomal protein L4